MILKRVEIFGFKSFGRKVVIEFDDAITGIVGPNGSGKSNIVDAIRWAIGEQRVKSLRGSRMEDVIFSGTHERKALGYAAVSLIIDNTNRIFPVDYEEINVTRKLYRSGESEYSINKVICRLRDVQELFMDTGLGREGYSIIGQGQIDSLITASPVERKLLIEEAVGVVKYKLRRMEAEKKLEKASSNLYRIGDILNEVSLRLPRLKTASEKASRYIELRTQQKDLEIGVFVARMDELTSKKTNTITDIDSLAESAAVYREELADLENTLVSSTEEGKDIDGQLAQAAEKLNVASADAEEARLRQGVLAARSESAAAIIETGTAELAARRSTLEELEMLRSSLEIEESDALKNTQALTSSFSVASRQTDHLEAAMNERSALLKDQMKQLSTDEETLADLVRGHNDIANRMENSRYIISRITAENQEISTRLAAMKDILGPSDEAADAVMSIKKKFIESQLEEKKAIEEEEKARSAVSEIFVRLSNSEQRLSLLKGYEASFSGYAQAVKRILSLRETPEFARFIAGTPGELLFAGSKYAKAISRALGAAADNIVVDTEKTATALISKLKQNRWGRVTFLPLNIIRGNRADFSVLSGVPGYLGNAADLVDCESRFNGIRDSLLGRTAVADTIQAANTMAAKSNFRFRIVTLDGEVLFPGGAIAGGEAKDDDGGVVGRRAAIAALADTVAKTQSEYETALAVQEKISGMLAAKRTALSTISNELRERETQTAKILAMNEAAAGERDRLSEQFEKNQQLLKTHRQERQEMKEQSEGYENDMFALKDSIKKNKAIMAEHTTGQDSEYYDALNAKNNLQVLLVSAREKSQTLTGRLKEIRERIISEGVFIGEKEDEIKKQQEMLVSFADQKAEAEFAEEASDAQKETLQKLVSELTKKKAEFSNAYYRANDRIRDVNRELSALSEQILRLHSTVEKIELEMDHLKADMMEDYAVTYASARNMRLDIELDFALHQITSLKESIRKLGSINTESLDEYRTEKERFETMSAQHEDLLAAKTELEKIIADVTANMASQFNEQFDLIQKEFNRAFKKLFNGGEARLILIDPDDISTSGVDIIAQPPKTRLKNIAALSGGEKAMCAIALIMAILKIKPSPFCILDEIDAALDDANVMRFSEYLKNIVKENQFVLITHKRKTMEIADVLYGASMGADGITKVLSVQLSNINAKGEIYV